MDFIAVVLIGIGYLLSSPAFWIILLLLVGWWLSSRYNKPESPEVTQKMMDAGKAAFEEYADFNVKSRVKMIYLAMKKAKG